MLDPLRAIAPGPSPAFLIRTANRLHLFALPLHAHEVLIAVVLYFVIFQTISPTICSYVFSKTFQRLSHRDKINWHIHVVSFIQSCLVNALSIYVILYDEERKTWRADENWELRIFGYTGLTGLLQSFALGYFLYDLYICLRYLDISGWSMVFHAIASSGMFSLGFRPFVYFYCPVFLLFELSTPFLNIHWFCDKLDLTGSIYQAVNGGFLVTTFFCCRLVWGTYGSIGVFRDVWRALFNERNSLQYSKLPNYGDLNDPIGQTASFLDAQHLPLWLGISYLTANVGLTILNCIWFSQMIAAIRKRFDPPLGTRKPGDDEGDAVKSKKRE